MAYDPWIRPRPTVGNKPRIDGRWHFYFGVMLLIIGIMHIDATDRLILSLLEENARMPTAELARRAGLSRTTVQSRIERLERGGAIAGYAVVMGAAARDAIRAHVMITLAPRHVSSVEDALRRFPEIRELHAVSGQIDMIAVVGAPTTEAINDAIDRIGMLEGVDRTTSAIVLSTRVVRQGAVAATPPRQKIR